MNGMRRGDEAPPPRALPLAGYTVPGKSWVGEMSYLAETPGAAVPRGSVSRSRRGELGTDSLHVGSNDSAAGATMRLSSRLPAHSSLGGGGSNFKVVIRTRPPLRRELQGPRPFSNVVATQRQSSSLACGPGGLAGDPGQQQITISENLSAALNADGSLRTERADFPCATHVFTFDHVYDQVARACAKRVCAP